MAYYYVKNGGTATGDAGRYATQQTGSFATLGTANYYDNILAAIAATTSPVTGDFINPSDLHDYDAGGLNLLYTGVPSNPFFIVVVDDANMDAGRTIGNRGKEATGGSADEEIRDITASGLEFDVGDDRRFYGSNLLIDCSLSALGSSDINITTTNTGDGVSLSMVGGEIFCGVSGVVPMRLTNGFSLSMSNVTLAATTTVTNLSDAGGANGGFTIDAKGCDFSKVTDTLIANVGSDANNDDLVVVRFDNVKIATGVAFTNETFKSYNQRALFTRCSDSSAAAEYQYHLHAFGGDVDDDSSIFRNEDEAFTESNQKISYKIVTNSDASLGSPLWLDFPILRYSELSAGATDTLRFYLTSNTALTDKDVYIEISYPDGTNKQTANFLSSAPTTVGGTLDLMATGTTLTTDSTSTWTGGLTNKYQIDLNTSVNVGADCLPIVKVYITKPSITIQIASEFGLS